MTTETLIKTENHKKVSEIPFMPLDSHAWDNFHGNLWDEERMPGDGDAVIHPVPTLFKTDTNYNFIISGPTGGGKTSCGVAICIYNAMLRGKPVYSVIPIGFEAYDIHNNPYQITSLPFDLVKFIDGDPIYWESFVLLDEANFNADVKRTMSNANMSITDIMQEGRKMDMSMVFTTINASWLDPRIVSSLADIKIECHDTYFTGYGHKKRLQKGELTKWECTDITGKYSGREWNPIQTLPVQNHLLWGTFNTKFFIKPGDARKSIQRKKNTIIINPDGTEFNPEVFVNEVLIKARKIASAEPEIAATDLWKSLGVAGRGMQVKIGSILAEKGVTKVQSTLGERVYDLSPLLSN
jgi:hypothetical protein